MLLCNGRGLVTLILCDDTKDQYPRIFYVKADPSIAHNKLVCQVWYLDVLRITWNLPLGRKIEGRVNREVQTVNWEAGNKGAVKTGAKSGGQNVTFGVALRVTSKVTSKSLLGDFVF